VLVLINEHDPNRKIKEMAINEYDIFSYFPSIVLRFSLQLFKYRDNGQNANDDEIDAN